jgi:hypothetical protein
MSATSSQISGPNYSDYQTIRSSLSAYPPYFILVVAGRRKHALNAGELQALNVLHGHHRNGICAELVVAAFW